MSWSDLTEKQGAASAAPIHKQGEPPERKSEMEKKIQTVCYDETDEWGTKLEAEHFFKMAAAGSEGSEQNRYQNILMKLDMGLTYCTDEDFCESSYEQLWAAEQTAGVHTIEIVETATGKAGVANTKDGMVEVFYGADDGSEDCTVTPAEFNRRFIITAIISS